MFVACVRCFTDRPLITLVLWLLITRVPLWGGDATAGYRWLTEKAYLPPDFDQETFDQLYLMWPTSEQTEAGRLPLNERRQLIMQHYGLNVRPDDPAGRPLQYVVSERGEWSMNCFACHGGSVEGATYPGAPNSDYALELLTSNVRATKLRLGKRLAHMDVGSLFMPLGTTRGTTNSVMFGVALLARRDADLNVLARQLPPPMTHHDMDAPPWWHFHRKKNLYIDGFAPRAHRPLMQFMLVEQNGPAAFRAWDDDFKDVFAYIDSVRPPRYPYEVDSGHADRGEVAFVAHCAECHGTYGKEAQYPERRVPIDVIATDPVRLQALTPNNRRRYAESWFADGHTKDVCCEPNGYVAPPLDGIWATAPYLHNGSVPTLWHLLHPDQRPTVWRRVSREVDRTRVGWQIEPSPELPQGLSRPARYDVFDTRQFGKSNVGHEFFSALSESERHDVLEYLKTL